MGAGNDENENGPLHGLGVLVTGGGTGIGFACAAALIADGAAVTICGRNEERLAQAASRLEAVARGGGSAHWRGCDVTEEDAVEATMAAAAEPTGRLGGVVANAGGGGGLAPYHMQDLATFESVLRLNVIGTMLCVKHAVPHMVRGGGGSFVGMSSIAGIQTHPYFGAYTAGKAGIEAIIRNAADEFGAAGVRFNAIRPGFILTELMEFIPKDSGVYASYLENTPMGDVGLPEDVGNLVRFLMGQESRWITGQAIGIDGGHSLRRGPDYGEFIAPGLGPDVMAGHLPGDGARESDSE